MAGKLDRRITLERGTVSDDGFNDAIGEPWSVLAEVWAQSMPLSDGERWRAGSIGATATHRFRIRYSSQVADLNPKDRLVFEGRVYDISGVKELGRRTGLEVTASARVD
ncbi:phage head closure protein [Pseudooceanicola sp.]|uniref:phage head closure protein n=1 Tax=Pseudooceanicola sp. TaxID=1914328 RepID=UPI00405887FA